jgi:hypothetical protein
LHAKDFAISINEQDEIPNFAALDRLSRRNAILSRRKSKLDSIAADPTLKRDERDKKLYERRRKYRQTDPFIHLTRAERSQLLEEALDLVGSHDGIRLFGEVVDKAWLHAASGETNALKSAFSQIVSRFDAFLTRFNDDTSTTCNGLIIMDREPTYEAYISDMFADFRATGHPYGQLKHVIDTPFFIDSKAAAAIQIVDICAFAVRRYVGKENRDGSPEEQNFRRIFHRFDRAGPKLHGLRHYCQRGTCGCLICKERGHDSVTPPQSPPNPA